MFTINDGLLTKRFSALMPLLAVGELLSHLRNGETMAPCFSTYLL